MTENKVQLSFEQQALITLSILVAGGSVVGTLLTPIFDTALGVSLNHAMISFLPDSFDSLKFISDDSEVFQKGQLILANLPLLLVVYFYCGSYLYVLSALTQRPPLKTAAYLFGTYCGFYLIGAMVSQLLAVSIQ